ncbi:MAG: nuclear transport factor 2 family protein [Actinomycetota bacterium]
MSADAFRKAVESFDLDAALACLAPDIVFHSPVTFKPFEGRDAVAVLFGILFRTFEDFRYVGEYATPDGDGSVLHFKTRIGDRQVDGIDMIHTRDDGLIDEFTVMVRPLSASMALRDTVGEELGLKS